MGNSSSTHPTFRGRFSEFLNTDDIVGRDEDLNNVLELLKTSKGKPVAICGPGDIGKSTFTHYVANRWDEQGAEYRVVFVNEISIDLLLWSDTFIDDLFHVCLPKCMYKCNCHRRYNYKLLIVLNNIRDYDIIDRYTFHPNNSNISVIVTTENEKLKFNYNFITYHLQPITKESSIQLFKSLLLQQANEEGIDQLVWTFADVPRGLCQAAVYIKEQRNINPGYSIQDYLQEYNKLYHNSELPDNFQCSSNKNLYVSLLMIVDNIHAKYVKATSTNPNQENFPGNTSSSLSKKCQNFAVTYKEYIQDLNSGFHKTKLQSINEKAYILLNCFAFCAPWDLNLCIFNLFTKELQQCGYPKDRNELYKVLEVLQKNFLVTLVKVFSECTVCSHFRICIRRTIQGYCQNTVTEDVKLKCTTILTILFAEYKPCCPDGRLQKHICVKSDVENGLRAQFHNAHIEHDACKTKWRPIYTAVMFTPQLVFNLFETLSEYVPFANRDVDAQTEEGLTALHAAIRLGNNSKAEYLIKRGCNILIKDKEGNTPFSLALMSQNRHVLNMVKNKKQCKEFINVGEQDFIECLNLYNHRNKIWVSIVKSTTGDTLRKFLVGWSTCYILERMRYIWRCIPFDMMYQITQYSSFLQNQEVLIKELAVLLLQGNTAMRIASAYMYTEHITISYLLNLLRDEFLHPELEAVTRESLYPEASYVYKIICLAIDGVEKKHPGSYNLLSVLAYCSPPDNTFNEHKFLQYNNITKDQLKMYSKYLKDYELRSEVLEDLDEIVNSVVRTYVWHRNQTRHVLQQVLHMRDEPIVTHCDSIMTDNSVPALNETQYTDEDIDKYLKTFVPPYIIFDASL